jgi:hypothetical protein
MLKQLSILIAVPILMVLAGCDQKPPTDTSTADATSEPPRSDTSDGPSTLDVQSAMNAGAAKGLECRPNQDEPADSKLVTAGTYCVCDANYANGGLHPTTNVKGEHLHEDTPVVVGRLADQTPVNLGGAAPLTFIRLEGGAGLSAMVSYPHVDADTGGNERPVTHLVNISRWIDPGEGPALGNCDKAKNIITISYCYWDPKSSDWLCSQDIAGAHLGDIHAQN